jgi:parallel beta-helix repeat protein
LNTVGIMLGSSGGRETRFDHNCVRENTWGLAADYRDLIDARIDHNASYYTAIIAFELFRIINARTDITFDHNSSRQDQYSYFIEGSKRSAIVDNTIESPRFGVQVSHSNEDLKISNNLITDPFGASRAGPALQGIVFAAAPAGMPLTTGALVSGNTITGMGTTGGMTGDGIVAAGPPNFDRPAVTNSQFLGNVTSDNLRYGIALRGGNNGNSIRGNVSERNGSFGIYVQGARDNMLQANATNENGFDGISLQRTARLGVNYDATDNELKANVAYGNGRDGIFADQFTARNSFSANQMLGNAEFDARDLAYPANSWLANVCVTDWPAGAICGIG